MAAIPGHPEVADLHHAVLVNQTVPGSLDESIHKQPRTLSLLSTALTLLEYLHFYATLYLQSTRFHSYSSI